MACAASTEHFLSLESAWRLHPRVSVRPEAFGALLYHFGTRKLSFLKDTDLVRVVLNLEASEDVRGALIAAGLQQPNFGRYLQALTTLAASQMIEERRA